MSDIFTISLRNSSAAVWKWADERASIPMIAGAPIEAGQVVYSPTLAPYMSPLLALPWTEPPKEISPLSKAEKDKLYVLQQEIMYRWRRKKAAIIRRADGTVERIPRQSNRMVMVEGEMISMRMQTMSSARSLAGMRRPSGRFIQFVDEMIRDIARGAGIPPEMMEEMRRREESRRMACGCPSCRAMSAGRTTIFVDLENARLLPNNVTVQRRPEPLELPESQADLHPFFEENGPLRRPQRRMNSIGNFGTLCDGEPRHGRNPVDYSKAIAQAERNREMQYDERTWEI